MNDTPTSGDDDQADTTAEDTPDAPGNGSADPEQDAADVADGEETPKQLRERVRWLEQIVQGILITDAAAAAGSDSEESPIGQAGTAAAVEETAEPDRGGPWNWVGIDQDRRMVLADELVAFVAWLEERYFRHLSAERFQLPADWYDNAVVVEVLTAVMVARQAAYSDLVEAPSAALAEWHERTLWPAVDRLQSIGIFRDNTLVDSTRTPIAQHGGTESLERAAAASAIALAAPPPDTDDADSDTETEAAENAVAQPADAVTEPIAIIRAVS